MKIAFTQIYSEPGANFNLPGPLLKAVREGLDSLGKTIEELSDKMGTADFELVFIISASRELEAIEVKGPNIRKRAREVEFSFFVPWRETLDFEQKVEYVLPKVAEGVCEVFGRYRIDTGGVRAAIQKVLREAKQSPHKFQYKAS